jgi:hypothetical protein
MKKFEKGQYVVLVGDYKGPTQVMHGLHKVEEQVGRVVSLVCVAPAHMMEEKYRITSEKLLLVTNSCLVGAIERAFVRLRHLTERITAIDVALRNLFVRVRDEIAGCSFEHRTPDGVLVREDVIGYSLTLRRANAGAGELLQVIGACSGLPFINGDINEHLRDEIYDMTERLIKETRENGSKGNKVQGV